MRLCEDRVASSQQQCSTALVTMPLKRATVANCYRMTLTIFSDDPATIAASIMAAPLAPDLSLTAIW